VEVLTTMHNGDNDKELERIRSEHPGEEDTCIMDRRVLGALAPTRCKYSSHFDFRAQGALICCDPSRVTSFALPRVDRRSISRHSR
jgi:serine/threonine protein phosphatase PrpC